MKKKNGFSVAGVIVAVVVVALLAVATGAVIDGNNNATDFSKYDFNTVIEANKDNGNIGDHVKGSADAPVLIFEYADYQCPGCASINPRVNKIVEELDGKLAVVYRSFLLSYHQNGTAAASAAEAAGLQGYWKAYADKLFAEQAEWEYAAPSKRTELFNKYFEEVTGGKGDLDKFNADIASDAVSKKISFDMGIGKRIDVSGTPAFYIDGQLITWGSEGVAKLTGAKTGDAVFFGADEREKVNKVLGELRIEFADHFNLKNPDEVAYTWVIDFPFYEWDDKLKKLDFGHNPFSMPKGGLKALEEAKTDEDKLAIKADQYDMVMNGYEVCSGAVRNYNPEIMFKVFNILGYNNEYVESRFSGMLNAFKFGAPPHAGCAPGLDRIFMVLESVDNIRDIVAFPKNGSGVDLMMNSPSAVDQAQLAELDLSLLED